jgi:hypothetical protein
MTNDTNVIPFPERRDTTSWSEISTRRQCPHKHKLHYIDGWRTDRIARPLATGILWHTIMDLHYRSMAENIRTRGRREVDLEPILDLFKESGAKDPDHPGHEIASTCVWMYDGYRKHWANDPEWEIIEVETEARVLIPGTDLTMVGRRDLIVRWRRNLWVVDHKSGGNLPSDKELDLDDQLPIYLWQLRQDGVKAVGAIFNAARTNKLKRAMTLEERFNRYFTYRTDAELDVIVEETADTIRSAYGPHATHERHPDPQTCSWKCQFVEACIAGRKAPHLEENMLRANGFTTPEDRKAAEAKTRQEGT